MGPFKNSNRSWDITLFLQETRHTVAPIPGTICSIRGSTLRSSPVCWVHLFYFICPSPTLTPIPRRTENGGRDYQSKLNPGALFFSSNSVPPKKRRTEDGGRAVTPRKRECVPYFAYFLTCLTSLFSWVKLKIRYTQENRERALLFPFLKLAWLSPFPGWKGWCVFSRSVPTSS